MPSQLSLLKDEFDDDNIYCPWSYKEDRLTEHFKSKQKQWYFDAILYLYSVAFNSYDFK